MLYILIVNHYERYLGLPGITGINKRRIFDQLKDYVWEKLKSWKEKSLSKAGKEIILKSII